MVVPTIAITRNSQLPVTPLAGNDGAGRNVDRVKQAQHQFGIVHFLVERVRGFLDVEIGEHARQRRTRVDAAQPRQVF